MDPIESNPSTTLVQPTTVQLLEEDGTTCLVETEFRYEQTDPYAVSITLAQPGGSAGWTFARELLVEGLQVPVGDGDVHIWPGATDAGRDVLLVELLSAKADMLFAVSPADVTDFVNATRRLVDLGEESGFLDVDAAIAAILTSAPTGRVDE